MPARTKLVVPPGFYYGLGSVQLDNVLLRAFPIPADKAKLQAWLDFMFAGPSGGKIRYDVIGSLVFLCIADIGRQYELDPVDRAKGWTTEIDAFLAVPARRENDGLFAIRSIPVYLFVDTGIALAAGREIWGFPKQLGQFEQDPRGANPGSARNFTAKAFVVSPFSPDTEAQWRPIIEVKPSQPNKGGGEVRSIEEFVKRVLLALGDEFALYAMELATALGADGLTMSFLKQTPFAPDPTLASYQAIIEANATITKLRAMGLTDDAYQLRVTSYDSHPFLSELGIDPAWQDVGQGIWVDYDFVQHLGQEIWRAD